MPHLSLWPAKGEGEALPGSVCTIHPLPIPVIVHQPVMNWPLCDFEKAIDAIARALIVKAIKIFERFMIVFLLLNNKQGKRLSL